MCTGTETSLLSCQSHSGQNSCNVLAGVTCTGTPERMFGHMKYIFIIKERKEMNM